MLALTDAALARLAIGAAGRPPWPALPMAARDRRAARPAARQCPDVGTFAAHSRRPTAGRSTRALQKQHPHLSARFPTARGLEWFPDA
jgi:hypothetical protein